MEIYSYGSSQDISKKTNQPTVNSGHKLVPPHIHPKKELKNGTDIMDPFFNLFNNDTGLPDEADTPMQLPMELPMEKPEKGFIGKITDGLRRIFQTDGHHINGNRKDAETDYSNTDFWGQDLRNDTIINKGRNGNQLFGLGGNDSLSTLNGKNNKLFGGDGDDSLFAFDEKNVLLDGGSDNDQFYVNKNVSGIIDGGAGDQDRLDLGAFTKEGKLDLSKFSVDKDGYIVIKTDNGQLTVKNVESFFYAVNDTLSASVKYDDLVKQIQGKAVIPIPVKEDPIIPIKPFDWTQRKDLIH